MKIIECVPNFSEGRDMQVIEQIIDAIKDSVEISMLDVDPGADTNRTVVTFVGHPVDVIQAAFQGIKKAAELIDMNQHSGAHARMGATDVCPFVPVSGVTMEECVEYSKELAKRVGEELGISVYLYEHSASEEKRRNLATVRAGEYEAMAEKIQKPEWKPDFGPTQIHKNAGVTAIGARNFLIAYNFNLNTQDVKIAKDIALEVREMGRNKRNEKGKFIRDENGVPIKRPGLLKGTKAVGWYIDEYKIAQISMNIVDMNLTSVHKAFETVREQARLRGVRVTGSELVGLTPKTALLDAGKFYLQAQKRSTGIPEEDLLHIAVKSLGLDDLAPFELDKKIIEYQIGSKYGQLANMSHIAFSEETSRDSAAPGGGSVAAACGAMGAALATMVSNLSVGKKGFKDKLEYLDKIAAKGQGFRHELLDLLDKDTEAFNAVMACFRLPKKTEEEIAKRDAAIDEANVFATRIPLMVAELCRKILDLSLEMAKNGNPNSLSDAGVSAEAAYAGLRGAALNVRINVPGLKNRDLAESMYLQAEKLIEEANPVLQNVRSIMDTELKFEK